MPRTIPSLSTPKIEAKSQFLADKYLICKEDFWFISSGTEFGAHYFVIDGKLRLDGKLIVGHLIINGELKISDDAVVETDSFLEESVV